MGTFRKHWTIICAVAVAATVCALPLRATGSAVLDDIGAGSTSAVCDPIDPARCLLPFPNDYFTVRDDDTDTGRRVALSAFATPKSILGVPLVPSDWNRNDGFSPGSAPMTVVPGLDLHATWQSELDHIQDLSWYARPDAPIVLLDAETGERHPFWSELEHHASGDGHQLLMLKPAVNLAEGHRYVVALRNLRRADGSTIAASETFAAFRDRGDRPATSGSEFDSRRPSMERLFGDLGAAGIDRDDLYLAWDFTVASQRSLTESMLSIRDEAFAQLGDTDLADGTIDGAAPGFAITSVEGLAEGATLRRVKGTVTVPNFLTPDVSIDTAPLQPVGDLLDQAGLGLPSPVDGIIGARLQVPFSRFVRDDGGLPRVNDLQPTVDIPFTCEIARTSLEQPSDALLYGHGLLGSQDEVSGGSTARLRERGFTTCATDWTGMSFADIANVAVTLVNASNFPSFADRVQQGFLDMLFLGRLLAHPDGLTASPAFRGDDGAPLVRSGDLVYNGNSQGGIMGGALTALAPDFTRSSLGVPGMNYSTLLNRSVDWEGEYGKVMYLAYPDALDQQIVLSLFQMLWDRAEGNGYAHHMTSDPLPNTPPHQVLLQAAFADHQVPNIAAEVEARTIGAKLKTPALPSGLHWSVDPAFGLETFQGDMTDGSSVLLYWFSEGFGLETPPNGDVPASAGKDPHGQPRAYGPAADQLAHFLRTGELLDACSGAPCVIPPK